MRPPGVYRVPCLIVSSFSLTSLLPPRLSCAPGSFGYVLANRIRSWRMTAGVENARLVSLNCLNEKRASTAELFWRHCIFLTSLKIICYIYLLHYNFENNAIMFFAFDLILFLGSYQSHRFYYWLMIPCVFIIIYFKKLITIVCVLTTDTHTTSNMVAGVSDIGVTYNLITLAWHRWCVGFTASIPFSANRNIIYVITGIIAALLQSMNLHIF